MCSTSSLTVMSRIDPITRTSTGRWDDGAGRGLPKSRPGHRRHRRGRWEGVSAMAGKGHAGDGMPMPAINAHARHAKFKLRLAGHTHLSCPYEKSQWSFFWGSFSSAVPSAKSTVTPPLGFESDDFSVFDARGNDIMATRKRVPAAAWNAFACPAGTPSTTESTLTLTAIADPSKNLCLTILGDLTSSNLTISRQDCINDLSTPPDPSQAFGLLTSPGAALVNVLFLGDSSDPTLGVTTNFIPTKNLSPFPAKIPIGAWISLDFAEGSFAPTEDTLNIVAQINRPQGGDDDDD
ncbi:hypothetical protein GGX14DRAFT_545659 [Mycena pura]|uniref:Uncharacterized protein n=1 Tax=Mycena pura TaxID=153505 RepID=A0AAD6Y2Y2_9AGAR|nr:hypothetical protein GGX14DRAFT_545659 [Mycena pura]